MPRATSFYDNSGALFKNRRKLTDKHPDLTGTLTMGGQEFWISGWRKTKGGEEFITLAVNPKTPKEGAAAQQKGRPMALEKQSSQKDDGFDEPIPF